MSLNGEVALVTGSARGLGRAMVQRLAALGAAVAIHDISPDACAEFGEAKDIDDVASQINPVPERIDGPTDHSAIP